MTTFSDLVTQLTQLDDALAVPFDSETFVADIRDKVDSLKYVLDRLSAYQDFLKAQIEPMQKARAAAARNEDALRKYIAETMMLNKLEKLPGDSYRVQLQDNPLSLEVDHEPTEDDAQKYPHFVETRTEYVWNKDAIKASIALGLKLPFARLVQGRHCRFYLNRKELK